MGYLFAMKPKRIRITIPCGERRKMHKMDVWVEPETLAIVRRTSPCSLHHINYDLGECATPPHCLETFDALSVKKAVENTWIVRELMIKPQKLNELEEKILKQYALKVLTKPSPELTYTQRSLVGRASTRQACRIILEAAQQIDELYHQCLDAIQAFAPQVGVTTLTRDRIELFAELNAIAIERANPKKNYPIILLTHPIMKLGELAGYGHQKAVQTIWPRLKRAYQIYFQNRQPKTHDDVIQQAHENIIQQLETRFMIGYESVRDACRIRAKPQLAQKIIDEIRTLHLHPR